MGFIYSVEKRRFERNWDKLRKLYAAAGMTAEAIQSIYQYDWDCFCAERAYTNHTQPLPAEYISEEETERSTLFRKYVNASITFDEADFSGRYAWVETVENQRLVRALRWFSDQDLELLTFLVIEGHTQQELARKWGCSQAAVSKRYKRILKFLAMRL